MDETTLQAKLDELIGAMVTLPPTERVKLEKLVSEAKGSQLQIKRRVSSLQDSLDDLRVAVTYLRYDLEATRFEKAVLYDQLIGLEKAKQQSIHTINFLWEENRRLRQLIGEEPQSGEFFDGTSE